MREWTEQEVLVNSNDHFDVNRTAFCRCLLFRDLRFFLCFLFQIDDAVNFRLQLSVR